MAYDMLRMFLCGYRCATVERARGVQCEGNDVDMIWAMMPCLFTALVIVESIFYLASPLFYPRHTRAMVRNHACGRVFLLIKFPLLVVFPPLPPASYPSLPRPTYPLAPAIKM